MTTIAVNKDMMASDSLADDGGTRLMVQKIYKIGNGIAGFAGSLSQGVQFISTLRAEDGDMMLETDEDLSFDENFCGIVLNAKGQIALFEHFMIPVIVRQKFYAIGSGAEAALAAMYMGADPYEAVKIACKVNVGTGGKAVKLLRG